MSDDAPPSPGGTPAPSPTGTPQPPPGASPPPKMVAWAPAARPTPPVPPSPAPYPPAAVAYPPAPPATGGRLDPAGVRPTLVVAAVIAVLFFGSQLVNAVVPDAGLGARPPGDSVDVGRLRLQLAPGWQQVDSPGGTRLTKGSVLIDVLNTEFTGEASALYSNFVAQALAPHAIGFAASEPSIVAVGSGLPAARGVYTGIFGEAGEVEGQLTALVIDGDGYVFDAWSQVGQLGQLLPEVELMLDTMRAGQ